MSDRKNEPVHSGVVAYFPRAVRAISRVSKRGNDKHNPGQPVHWSKDKSTDHPDCAARHALTPYEIDPETGELHLAHKAWRTLAWLETVLEALENGRASLAEFAAGRVDFAELGAEVVADERRVFEFEHGPVLAAEDPAECPVRPCCQSEPCKKPRVQAEAVRDLKAEAEIALKDAIGLKVGRRK